MPLEPNYSLSVVEEKYEIVAFEGIKVEKGYF